MSTTTFNLRYRPLRIGWCIEPGDLEGFRKAVRWNFTLWGGRFNPIIPIGDPGFAARLIHLFRVDTLFAPSASPAVSAFIETQSQIPRFDFGGPLVMDRGHLGKASTVADLMHPIGRLYQENYHNNPQAEPSIRLHGWADEDPLADLFLTNLGGLPPANEIAEDYPGLMQLHLRAERVTIGGGIPPTLPPASMMSLSAFNRLYIKRHYAVDNNWTYPGFYIGDATSFEDLVTFWNLRATDIPLIFYDPAHAERLDQWKNDWQGRLPAFENPRRPHERAAIWHREEFEIADPATFGADIFDCTVRPHTWNGLNVRAPYMMFGEATSLASVDKTVEPPAITIPVPDNPLAAAEPYYAQKFVISVDHGIGSSYDERFTLNLPYLPELNEFYGRNVHWRWNHARAEPGSLGVISDAATKHLALRPVSSISLVEAVFQSVGIAAELSAAGLLGSRLVRQMGGIDSCRVFRIGGVRELIERYAPDQSFTRSEAKRLIFAEGKPYALATYQGLYIEQRGPREALTNDAIFAHLLRHEIFRPGLKLACPSCKLDFWRSIDDVRTRNECEYCGHVFNLGPQLRDRDWAFRRSGLFGRRDNQEGAIPVTLVLQQLTKMHDLRPNIVTMAMTLRPDGADITACESDLILLAPSERGGAIQIVIGECKTRQPISEQDVANLRRVADAFPKDMFEVYIVFAKLADFDADEIQHISSLNDEDRRRAIMLTARELEPWFIYERAEEIFDIIKHAVTFREMADNTHNIFIEPQLLELDPDQLAAGA